MPPRSRPNGENDRRPLIFCLAHELDPRFRHPDDLAKTENLELLSQRIVDGFLTGRHRSQHKGGGAEFAEHRAYYPGDEIRLLDWRVFGKSDRYCIKQFEEETSLQAIVVVDASGSMGFGLSTVSKYVYSRAAQPLPGAPRPAAK